MEMPVDTESTSEKAHRMARNIIGGFLPKYDPEYHIPILLEHFMEGRSISAFCYSAEVCEKTFFNWVDKYPPFRISYEVAKRLAEMWWEQKALLNLEGAPGITFNQTLWSMVMRNRFNYTEHRRLHVPNLKTTKNLKEQVNALIAYLADGNLTAPEANQISNLILAAMKVEEHTEVKKELAELKSMMSK